MSFSSDCDSYYSISLNTPKNSPNCHTIKINDTYEKNYIRIMALTFAYSLLINIICILISYLSIIKLGKYIKFIVICWSIIKIFITLIYQPSIFGNTIKNFSNINTYVKIYYIFHFCMNCINLTIYTLHREILLIFIIWTSLNLFVIWIYINSRCLFLCWFCWWTYLYSTCK